MERSRPHATRSAEEVSAPASPEDGRYEVLERLGAGGMGVVHRAFDRQLKRFVALKFLRSPDPRQLERFVREAEAQARIEHPNVCRVYDVGTLDGRRYIAMQYLEAEPWDRVAPRMTVEENLVVARDVAQALHAAHREGLVHRDIKPANILLSRGEHGRWTPTVVDFGLARLQEAPGLTVTGTIVGTPSYMPPELLGGEVSRADRRADVYSLGATLYEGLCGQRPHGPATSLLSTLSRLAHEEPVPLRRVVATIPGDVETIVMRCLERDPERRYPSARALAEDLDRFLDGEPIRARPPSLLYRWRKKASKNRALVAVAAAAVAVVLTSIGLFVVAARRDARQDRLARELGQELEVVASVLRHAHTSPLHDVRAERRLAAARLAAIETVLEREGPLAVGPASYALGRGHLLLGDAHQARDRLEAAWAAGYHSPEVAYALGEAYLTLYQRGLREAERLPDEALRQGRRAELAASLRDPAQRYLHLSIGAKVDSPALLEARLAYAEGRMDEAMERARAAHAERGWIYAARLLEGDVALDLGDGERMTGRYEKAVSFYEAAESSYEAAAATARSDPEALLRLCELGRSRLVLAFYRALGEQLGEHRGAVTACERALEADPELAEARRALGEVHWRLGEALVVLGRDPRAALEASIEVSRGTLEVHPRDAVSLNQLAIAWRLRGRWEMARGGPARASLAAAVDAARGALEADPRFAYAFNTLGGSHKALAELAIAEGGDPTPDLERAIAAYDGARRLDPRFLSATRNAAATHLVRARHLAATGRDPAGALERAQATAREALAVNPRYTGAQDLLGDAALLAAEAAGAGGGDPAPHLEAAVAAFETSVAIDPSAAHSWLGRALALTARLEHGDASASEVLEAQASFDRAARLGLVDPALDAGRRRLAVLRRFGPPAPPATGHDDP